MRNTDSQQVNFWLAALLLPTLLVGCATHCVPEQAELPARSNFARIEIPISTETKSVATWHTRSAGQPILLLHALNGISPVLLQFALELDSCGHRVYIPSLYGDPIMGESAFGYDMALEAIDFLKTDPRWTPNKTDDPGSILEETREITRWIANRDGSDSLIVIGNCLTGSFPIALLSEPSVELAVIAQPATPVLTAFQVITRLPQSPHRQLSLGISRSDLDASIAAIAGDRRKRIVGFHYAHDPIAPVGKFDTLHRRLRREGLEHHFRAYFLEPEDSRFASRRRYDISSTTEVTQALLVPHSTIINPESTCDRDWFRAMLKKELAR